ncbi:hypothetical protein GOBAR_AA10254 [Gossypium barbadense]|uniref:Mannosyltransferase n=1 Tax=Gossypium barbadense TaxID=3634 RepID=A0A2P5Y464_GOSBA|nr:hypothetical protein GOBAR_AA10254 [Gossypium barbadense]
MKHSELQSPLKSIKMRQRKNGSSIKHPNLSDAEAKSQKKSPYSLKDVFLTCLGFRMLNALLIQTYFNPDEHWQALEVAHRIAFGYGHLTWEWEEGIRSYLHPMMFALFYKLLALLRLDIPCVMIKAPRLLQSIFSALFSQLANWFMFFCFNRTFSNSLETTLTLVGLYYWPSVRSSLNKAPSGSRKWGLALAALACAIRPTSAVTWVSVVLGITCLLDRLMYDSWVLVPLNFLKFNFLSSGGDYYGTHKWHWYFTQGFTVMVFTFLPFCVAGIIKSKYWKLSGLILWVLGLYSILAALDERDSRNGAKKRSSCICNKWPSRKQLAIFFLLASNIPMALYMSLIHQRGTEDAMNYLSKEAAKGKVKSIVFLMPCHATPYYSTLHNNLPMRFLDCTPNSNAIHMPCSKGMPTESDRFMMDPVSFAVDFAKNWSHPSHIVLFDSEERHLKDFLISHSFREVRRFFHAHFKVDRDLQASVVVYAD